MRLGHVNERGLVELNKQGLLKEKLDGKLKFCEQCIIGKSWKVKFSLGMHTTKEPLAYVHFDL